MAKQVKLLKNLSLIVAAAVVITLAPAVSVIGEEVITLTTIMPSQDTLRVKRGAVGLTYKETATLSNEDIGDNNLLIEGKIGIGTTTPEASLHIGGTAGPTNGIKFPNGTVQTTAGGIPAGVLMAWTTDTAPSGWLLCYGQAVDRVTYETLFTVIGTTFGNGNGSTTFELPDLRGRMPLGQDRMGGSSANEVRFSSADFIGESGGEDRTYLSEDQMPAHTHTISDFRAVSEEDTVGGLDLYERNTGTRTTNSTGNDEYHNNMPPYLTMTYIIKY